MIDDARMKTESESPDLYLDFIRQHGIPSALRRENAKSETGQRVWQRNRVFLRSNGQSHTVNGRIQKNLMVSII
jgi:hypothetical protein